MISIHLPKKIFTYWHQGFEQAPPIIQACIRTLACQNDQWDIHFLDSESVGDWIDPIPIPDKKWNRMQVAHRSDVIRTQLLVKFGGVWADPTIWFCKPLDHWLGSVMDAGVFMFHRPGRDRAVSNWFIAAAPKNALLQRQYDSLCTYWRENEFANLGKSMSGAARLLKRVLNRNLELPRLWLREPVIRLFKTYPYMIYHYMIYDLACLEPELRVIWKRMPKISADIAHLLAHRGLLEPLDPDTQQFIDSGRAPLYKLTWKLPTQAVPAGSVLEYLLNSDRPESGAVSGI